MNFNVKTLQDAIKLFSDEQSCIDIVASLRWKDGKPECPACGHHEHYYLATQKRWKCKECWKQFSVKVGTIFEDSPISLDKWLIALWMLTSCKNGISSYELARTVGITQKSAWFVLHRLRLVLQQGSITRLGGGGTPVEVDETFIGGKARNMHKSKRLRVNVREGNHAKTIVMGVLERGGQVRTKIVSDRSKRNCYDVIMSNVERGATVITDEHVGYQNLSDLYAHEVINHLSGYVREHVYTNGIENFWSLLKRGLNGTYVSVEPFHLFRYVDEQAFRFNTRKSGNRKLTDAERFNLALSQVAGKRLTFAEVTGKVGETSF